MEIKDSVLAAIGNTPLIKLHARVGGDRLQYSRQGRIHEPRPFGQGPRRAGHHHRRDRARGSSGPAGTIVDGTAGNTGIGLTIVGNALGMRTVIVIPETQSQEKKDTLRSLGAELIEVPAVPYSNPNNYVKVAGRVAERLAHEEAHGAIWANQFDNVANRDIHVTHHRPRNLGADRRQGRRLRQRDRHRRDAGRASPKRCASGIATSSSPSPTCRARRSTATTRPASSRPRAARSPKASARAASPPTSKGSSPTQSSSSPTRRAWKSPSPCSRKKGLALGLSSGVNVAGAIRLARELGPGKTIVTMLCDPATRYQSRLFNPEFLRSKGLSPPEWLERPTEVEPDFVPVPASV